MPSRRPVAPAKQWASRGRVLRLLSLVALLVLLAVLGSLSLLSTVHDDTTAAGTGSASGGELRLSNALGSNMVLQRGVAAAIWGQSLADDTVECTLLLHNGNTEVATSQRSAQQTGQHWVVTLRPQPAGGPHQLVCTSTLLPGATVTLKQVFFGDVFLCAGQSNMVFPVNRSFTAAQELQDAAAVPRPGLRIFAAAPDKSLTAAPVPHAHGFRSLSTPWSPAASPGVVSGFSAVCWTAGKTIYDALGGEVPIGLIAAAAGGSCIEKWSPDVALRACGQPVGQGSLYSAMIAPLVPHTRLAGVLWYQGESNVGPAASGTCGVQGLHYECAFSQLLTAWRLAFNKPDLPWAHVQLSPFTPFSDANGSSLALLRHAQLAATQRAVETPTALVTAIDQGDADSPYGDIHPRGKAAIGARLAGALLHLVYGNTTAWPPWRSPVCVAAQLVDAGPGATAAGLLRVVFHSDEGDGLNRLVLRPPAGCHPQSGAPGGDARLRCAGWELQSDGDGSWHAAQGVRVENGSAVVMGAPPGLRGVAGVRYAWSAWPALSLFSTSGLPALPCALDVVRDTLESRHDMLVPLDIV